MMEVNWEWDNMKQNYKTDISGVTYYIGMSVIANGAKTMWRVRSLDDRELQTTNFKQLDDAKLFVNNRFKSEFQKLHVRNYELE